MAQTYDVVVIGGGIMGCSSALHLARRGLNVVIVEKQTVGQGPTGQSSAIIRTHYSNEVTARMALHSLRVFQNFEDEVGGDCGFTTAGFVIIVADKDRAGLEANVALQRRVGINTEMLEPEAFKEMVPGLQIGDLVAVAHEPESGYADPYSTVTAYAQAAQQAGATLMQNTAVTDILFGGGRVKGVRTTQGDLSAPVVLNSAGAWGAQVARMANVSAPIDPCRVQVAFFRRPPGHERPHPVIGDFINATYFRSETGHLTLVGLIDPEEANNIVDPDNFKVGMDDSFLLEAGERLVRRYPAMEMSQSTGGYASLYAITPDWHPIIDEAPESSGFYICSGFSGHGFKLGPAVGLMIAEMITGSSSPTYDTKMFSLDRFDRGEMVRGQYEYSIVG
ncbi:MAG: FAD-binding oxidoreductase [Candidatus Promineifilaceae bacterium]|nr:FAD-binding oxidoreductase [Candidatus Promineifilaceae bacterium]